MPRRSPLALSLLVALLLLLARMPAVALAHPLAAASAPPALARLAASSAPAMFIENAGQWAEGARFQLWGGEHTLWLADDGLWITLAPGPSPVEGEESGRAQTHVHLSPSAMGDRGKGMSLKVSFPGANPHPRLEPFARLETRVSYFLGSDESQWHADVPVWGGVRYVDLYPGIDLEVTGENGQIVQRIVARSGADLGAVRLRVEGSEGIAVEGDHLRLVTALGEVTWPLLQAAGEAGAERAVATASPRVDGDTVLHPLVAHGETPAGPAASQAGSLAYSSFLGGTGPDWGRAIAVDAAGCAYVTGYTFSASFPTTAGAFDTSFNSYFDAYVAKLNASGTGLSYATFLGGYYGDVGYGIAVDGAGCAYVTGAAGSPDFPSTPGAFDPTQNGDWDVFVAKLNANGTALVYSTFLGGYNLDEGFALALDAMGCAYVAGTTYGSNTGFPTTAGAFDGSNNGAHDAFVAKLNAGGTGLLYSTFLGGYYNDSGNGIAVDAAGCAYVAGSTASSDFPHTAGALAGSYRGGPTDAFVARLNAGGTGLLYSTFLGGSRSDEVAGIAIDGQGVAYVAGRTDSSDFPTTAGAFDTGHNGAYDAFVAKVNAGATGLLYSTFLGGSADDYAHCIAVDAAGRAYVAGETASSNLATTANAFDRAHNGSDDVFLTQLNSGGTGLLYSTFLGGGGIDEGYGLAMDGAGRACVTGYTTSDDYPTTADAFSPTVRGAGDAFVAVFAIGSPPPATPTPTRTRTTTSTPSRTPTATQSATPSRTPTATPTPTSTRTPTRTLTPTRTQTPTNTPTPTPCADCVIYGHVTVYNPDVKDFVPLPGISVELRKQGLLGVWTTIASTTASSSGAYIFEVSESSRGTYRVRVPLRQLHDVYHPAGGFEIKYMPALGSPVPHIETADFALDQAATQRDLDFGVRFMSAGGQTNLDAAGAQWLVDLGIMYYHIDQAESFAISQLGVHALAFVEVRAFASEPTQYAHDGHILYISGNTLPGTNVMDAEIRSTNRPLNREWHEYFHHVMRETVYTAATTRDCGNHQGFLNATTDDSWAEGWAMFWALALKEHLGYLPKRAADCYFAGTCLNVPNMQVWDTERGSGGTTLQREDMAVASLLWDLHDAEGSDQAREVDKDQLALSVAQLRDLLLRSDAKGGYQQIHTLWDVYNLAQAAYPPEQVDETFRAHGFFGDQGWSVAQCQVNAAGNKALETPEAIGEGGRQGRHNVPLVPGADLRLRLRSTAGSPVRSGSVVVRLRYPPPYDLFDTTAEARAYDGELFYLELPPSRFPMTVEVRGDDPSSPVYSTTNTGYWSAVASTSGGYVADVTVVVRGENITQLPIVLKP